jgi:hypothetical protein
MTATTDDMALSQRPGHGAAIGDGKPPCSWSCHPLREEPPLKSVALGVAIVGTAVVMATSLGNLAYGAIAIVVLVGATMGYLLPTRYVVNAQGAAWKQLVWRRRPWEAYRRAEWHTDGIFLSPFRQRHRLDSFRGIFLRFGADTDTDQVEAWVRTHVAN